VYIDGFNLYYGAVRDNPALKWLDIARFCQLLRPNDDPRLIRYFSALVEGSTRANQEIYLLRDKGRTWVIATFETFHVYAVDHDYELLYTEINFRVENVLKLPEGLSLSDSALVDAGLPGGRVRMPKGEIATSRVEPKKYEFQPGNRYLLQLLYEPKGDFFIANQRLDLTSGKVEPYTGIALERLANKNSAIVGMTVPELIRYLPSVLPDEPED
jgi:hypothetical protein